MKKKVKKPSHRKLSATKKNPNRKTRITVVGNLGSYGAWFSHFFRSYGHDVKGFDVGEKGSVVAKLLAWADVVLFAVPHTAAVSILESYGKKFRKGQLLIDISARKRAVYSAMMDTKADFVQIHPLCRPNAGINLSGCKVVVITPYRLKSDRNLSGARTFLRQLGGKDCPMTLDQHELEVESVMRIVHACLYTGITALRKLGLEAEQIKELASPVTEMFFAAAQRHFDGISANAFTDIQRRDFGDAVSYTVSGVLENTLIELTTMRAPDEPEIASEWEESRFWLLGRHEAPKYGPRT